MTLATDLAGDRNISVAAGDVGGQALRLDLIDYVAIDVVPVIFGSGKPFFGSFADSQLMLGDPDTIIQGNGVLHLRYPIHRATANASRTPG